MTKKHGVQIIEHKDWNTKQVWNRGHLMMTYRYVPKKIHFKNKMVNDKNQDLCGGWFMDDCGFEEQQMRLIDRVGAGLKPMGVLHYDSRPLAFQVANAIRNGTNLDVKVTKTHNYEVALAQHGTLVELFDLDALALDYIDNGIFTSADMARMVTKYSHHRLIDFSEGWDVEDIPAWVTGLILGYPVENTISLYRMGNIG